MICMIDSPSVRLLLNLCVSQCSKLFDLADLSHSALEKPVPLPHVSPSFRTNNLEDRYAPPPCRSAVPSVDSSSTPNLIDQLDKVVEIADIPELADDTVELVTPENGSQAVDQFSKTAVAFFGDVLLHVGKKDRKKVHARLRAMKISFHDDDTTEEFVAGPFSLLGCELICREESTITIRLNERETTKSVVFTSENDAETWILLLGECWLSEYELLRSSVQDVKACGTFWLRQGATSDWMYAAAGLQGRTMFYVLLDSPDYIYELDVRKILLLRERVDKTEWCPKCKKKDQKGPFLISLEGCALYLECCDDLGTTKWFSAIQDALAMAPAVLEDFRLTADNIPILVDKCIRFVAAYGIRSEGIYRRNGKISEAKDIYKRLTEDPVKTHIAVGGEETVYAVADVLRQFFRRLKSPLFPPTLHKQIFNLVEARTTADNAIRYQEYRHVLQQMPLVHYHTLRKLIAHLSEMVKYQDVNKASVENVAKVFGPSLFEINDDESNCYKDTAGQIGAIIDLINGYDVIFEVTSREEICRAMVEQAQISKATNPHIARADGLLVPIHVWERENRPFNVKIDLAAEEVCRKAVARRGFDAPQDGNYAIFEVILSGTLSRRLPPFEKLSVSVLDHWLPWQCTDGYLLFDHDNWPYDGNEVDFYTGKVKIAEPGSKTFHSYDVSVEGGIKITAYKHDKLWKEWVVADSVFYSGCSPNRKAPNAHNVTILDKKTVSMTDKLIGYCVSFRLMPERTRFLNMIQFIETAVAKILVMFRTLLPSVRAARLLSTESVASSSFTEEKPLKKIGRALETYIKLSREHVSMMARERADFELGRRHLANMMNMDPHTMTQEDIDTAISYLFPSGLFDLKARPVMRPPDEIMPKFHRFEFDEEGRPKDSRFFTLRPAFYKLLSDIGIKTRTVTSFYNDHLSAGSKGTEIQSINTSGTQWLSREKLEKKLDEKITEEMVSDAGTGKFDIDGVDLPDFRHLIAREILLAPMLVAGLLGRVDVKAKAVGSGGITALPRAVRHGTALGIAALYPEKMEPLRLESTEYLQKR
ncbi:RhoGAP and Ras-association domain containing protein [Trichostrongylus colubriformis]|uniref:RhoGAP and Ras-association domain containing protein n=1 Tax=Trichostrongylus colubriformis TaxID=6319 RepID=A0AAN8FY75_TRICO